MRSRISSLKAEIREFMLSRYYSFLPLLLVYFLLEIIVSFIPASLFSNTDTISSVLQTGTSFILNVLFGMAGVGIVKAALDTIRGQAVRVSTLFYAFQNRPNRFIIIQLIFTAIKTVCSLPIIPLNLYADAHPEMTMLQYYGVYFGISLFALFITMLATLRLIWANYYMLDNMYLDAGEALKKSLAFSKGRTFEIFYMKLSFLGMYILSYISLLIGFIYVRPYAEVTYAKYYMASLPAPVDETE